MTITEIESKPSLKTVSTAVGILAVAGGVVHLEATYDHRDLLIISIGFAAMAVSQLGLAFLVVIRPTRAVVGAIGALHAAIAMVWLLSRTLGLAFVPGAEQVAQVGVADVVANTFSIAVVGATCVALSVRPSEPAHIPSATATTAKIATLLGALILTVAALSATHTHFHDDTGATQVVEHNHGHDHTEHEH